MVLALSCVGGDLVAGIGYMGNQDLNSPCSFVLGPLVLYLLVGMFFCPGRFCVALTQPQHHQAGQYQHRQAGEAHDPHRHVHTAVHRTCQHIVDGPGLT